MINQEDILSIRTNNYKKNGLLSKHDRQGENYCYHTPCKNDS
jgi:hypothetical protein